MKITKRKKLLIGLAAGTLFSVGGFSSCRGPETVYGPPTDFEMDDNQNEDVYGPPVEDLDLEDNVPEAVYGPPSYFGEEDEEEETPTPTVSANEADDVYGPPVDMNTPAPVYGPPPEEEE